MSALNYVDDLCLQQPGHPAESGWPTRHPCLTGVEAAMEKILAESPRRQGTAGQPLLEEGRDSAGLIMVLEGVACHVAPRTGLCLGLIHGGEAIVAGPSLRGLNDDEAVWLTDGVAAMAPIELLTDVLGRDSLLDVALTVSARRRAATGAEFECCVRHGAARRLGRWVLQCHEATGLSEVAISQSRLAALSGLQRTSVCAAMSILQTTGGLRVIRGRIRIEDPDKLARQACECAMGGALRYGAASEPSGRPADERSAA